MAIDAVKTPETAVKYAGLKAAVLAFGRVPTQIEGAFRTNCLINPSKPLRKLFFSHMEAAMIYYEAGKYEKAAAKAKKALDLYLGHRVCSLNLPPQSYKLIMDIARKTAESSKAFPDSYVQSDGLNLLLLARKNVHTTYGREEIARLEGLMDLAVDLCLDYVKGATKITTLDSTLRADTAAVQLIKAMPGEILPDAAKMREISDRVAASYMNIAKLFLVNASEGPRMDIAEETAHRAIEITPERKNEFDAIIIGILRKQIVAVVESEEKKILKLEKAATAGSKTGNGNIEAMLNKIMGATYIEQAIKYAATPEQLDEMIVQLHTAAAKMREAQTPKSA
jgi:hypothetical protein